MPQDPNTCVPKQSLDSLAFRSNLARLISPLQRVRPRVPFYQLAAHRIPTLWSLYRGLLREAPTGHIKFRVKMMFRQNHHLTSAKATQKHLLQGYRFLDAFRTAKQGDKKLQAVLGRYSKLIATQREKEYWKQLARKELAWQAKLRRRPIMTGGYLRPTLFNKPLPRLKPQPVGITLMIAQRRKARQRRIEKMKVLKEALNDLRLEREFEQGLAKIVGEHKIRRVYSGPAAAEWEQPIHEARAGLLATFRREHERSTTPYPPALQDAIKRARREKVENKTRELERERRGEILRRTIMRRNRGPPAHVLRQMSAEQRAMDKVARSVSEVGYVAQVKRRLGFKLRNPDAWKEVGNPEDNERLERIIHDVHAENRRRRRAAERRRVEDGTCQGVKSHYS